MEAEARRMESVALVALPQSQGTLGRFFLSLSLSFLSVRLRGGGAVLIVASGFL